MFSGIEVNSEILSEKTDINKANIVKKIGTSPDCHLFIRGKEWKIVKEKIAKGEVMFSYKSWFMVI